MMQQHRRKEAPGSLSSRGSSALVCLAGLTSNFWPRESRALRNTLHANGSQGPACSIQVEHILIQLWCSSEALPLSPKDSSPINHHT